MYTSIQYDSIISEIRSHDFRNHVATLERFGPITVVEWRRPDTNAYAVRYVCDGNRIYITGDLGTAVFALSWIATIHAFDGQSLSYLHEKLKISSEPDRAMEFDPAYAAESIRFVYDDATDQDMVVFCARGANDCIDLREWGDWLSENTNEIEGRLDQNWFETLPNIGTVYCRRFLLWVTGLQMASEQLVRAAEAAEEERG